MKILVSISDLTGWADGMWKEGCPDIPTEVYAELAGSKDPLVKPIKVRGVWDVDEGRPKYRPVDDAAMNLASFAIISGYAVVPVELVGADPGFIIPLQCEEE